MNASSISSRRLYWAAIVFAGIAASSLAIDMPAAKFFRPAADGGKSQVPGDVRKALMLAEVFGHGAGVAAIIATAFVISHQHRRSLPRIVACAFGSGLVAEILKFAFGRTRPDRWDLNGDVWDSFLGWFPLANPKLMPTALDRAIQSFPSGHAATAVGLAIALSWLYPHGRWLFATFATLAALQRIAAGAHYPSDTLASAAIACFIAGLCLDSRCFGKLFDRWERRGGTAST